VAIAQDHQSLQLDYVPALVYHVEISAELQEEHSLLPIAILVSGSDKKLHIYVQSVTTRLYSEQLVQPNQVPCIPPQLFSMRSPLLSAATHNDMVAYGCENGTIIFRKNPQSDTEIIQLDGPISVLSFYSAQQPLRDLPTPPDASPRTKRAIKALEAKHAKKSTNPNNNVHLVAGGPVCYGVVCQDVQHHGLTRLVALERSNKHDAVFAAFAMDCDLSGNRQLVLGTFGGHLLVYSAERWELLSDIDVEAPIYSAQVMDRLDCISYVALNTNFALSVFAPPLQLVQDTYDKRFAKVMGDDDDDDDDQQN